MSRKKTEFPSWGLRIPAALLALAMTICLWGAQLSLLGLQVMTSTGLHQRAALAADVVDLQMARIREKTEKLAEENGFPAETLLDLIRREDVEAYDRQVVAWWTGAAASGKLEAEPLFHLEGAVEALRAQESFTAGLEPMMESIVLSRIAGEAEEIVQKSAVLFRDVLVEAGVRMAGERVNLPQITALLRKVPPLAGLGALLCAGLIALLLSRRIQAAGQYIGGALSAVGLLMVLGLIGMRILNIGGMIAEASALMTAQYAHLARIITLETLGGAAVLMAAGGLLMAWAGKEYRRHEA